MNTKKIIILGAGGAGLAACLRLTEMGFNAEVFEAKSVPGGQAGGESIDGMYYDYGPHIYHTDDNEINTYWQMHFGDLLEPKEFFSLNYKDGKYYEYPLSYEAINNFPEKIKTQVLKELNERKPEHFKRAVNFKQCLTALLGPSLEEMFFDEYSRKLWGLPTDQISATWAPKRIEIRKEHKSFWYNQHSYAPIYGSDRIMRRMVELIERGGNKINLSHEVTKFEIRDFKINGIHFANGHFCDTTDAIILSTIPINLLADLVGLKNNLRFTKYILAYLILAENEIIPDNYQTIYFAHEYFYFHRVTEQKKYSNIGYPKNKTLLCFEISCNEKPFLNDLSEEELVEHVLEQFCSAGLVTKDKFIKGFTRVLSHVNPIFEIGFEEELANVQSKISSYNNLHTVGSPAEFEYGDLQILFAKSKDIAELLTSKHYIINKNVKSGRQFRFSKEVEICGFKVGDDNPPLIIAEIGLNHNGDINMAKELIAKANECGVNIVKLQTYSDDGRVSQTAKSAKYADKTLQMEETTWEMFKRYQLSAEDHLELFDYAKDVGIPVISTPFDENSVDLLYDLGVEAFKIASFDIVNLTLLRFIASKQKPIILSTGMSSLADVEEALDAIAIEGNPNVVLLHCISSYPSSPLDVNLKVINTLKQAFNVPVGYSDHTIGNLIANVAISLGANVVEKHFTLNRHLEGPDHILSADPNQMAQLVDDRNIIYSALGNGIKKPAPSEYRQINLQRKSIFTSVSIKSGEKITLDNIVIKGPGHGLLPKYFQIILGKTVTRDIGADTPLTWDDVLQD